MKLHTASLCLSTHAPRELVDITALVRAEVAASGITHGTCSLLAQGATAALMTQENDDPNLRVDVLDCLNTLAPPGGCSATTASMTRVPHTSRRASSDRAR